ncbi:SIR2 family protein [Rhodoferax sp. TBRC 17198]|uniref:SIR2 family protein n=1 Tax=Rhodoferax potami TaxID=3068338 RepID=UPI0028BE677C|nr:SIR2 family protein [Rhodoferax sp. TBRC 17198]MDT7523987.1 SIR2 family protein [Rhodoferax sp. TBRC 17198]
MKNVEAFPDSDEVRDGSIAFDQNERFNDMLDDGDLGEYALTLKRPDGTESPIPSISRALFYADRPTYSALLNEQNALERKRTLRLEGFPTNEAVFERLQMLVRRQAIVLPFIGAGFSVAAGCPSWRSYVVQQAIKGGMDEATTKLRLQAGEHELVMDEVIAAQTLDVFTREFRSAFENPRIDPSRSPSTELIDLFGGAVITTNFDRVLENCHQEVRRPFTEKVVGNEDSYRFIKAAFQGEKYLLKLHGNIDDQKNRVLTRQEYDQSYANDRPVPRTLMRVFASFSIVFLGCSLIADRYLSSLKDVFEQNRESMPDHFAILTAPDDEQELRVRDQFLASHGISPIWYSEGDWDAPGEILQLLKQER